jgi:type II secretion system protein F
MNYRYKAVDASGGRTEGAIEGDSQAAAVQALLSRGLHATAMREAPEGAAGPAVGASFSFGGRISPLEMSLFLRQLSTLVNSDVSLLQSLTILQRQMTNQRLREILESVRTDVQGGSDFSQALGRYPRVFTPLIVSMVRVGETGGVLGPILEELAAITERDQQTRSEVRTAMVYPIVVVAVGILVVGILMTQVVPKLTSVFADMGVALPMSTQLLLAISAGAKNYWWVGLAGVAGLGVALRLWRATDEGRLASDLAMLRAPIFGDLARKASISRFSRALGVLLGGGVTLLESLQVVKGVLANAALGAAIDRASAGLREGQSLARELEKEELFPPLVTHMIGVGEDSGALDRMLIKIAETYEWQTQQAVKIMLSLLTPVMILCLAVVVGFIALALVMPIYSMNELIA